MAKYNVSAYAIATVSLGMFEADTEEDAIEMAFDQMASNTIALCYECTQNVGELVIDEDTVSAKRVEKNEKTKRLLLP